MSEVTMRELRNNGSAALQRVQRGEQLTVTRDGEPIAVVVPLPRGAARVEDLIARRRHLPRLDAERLRADIDEVLDPGV